MLRPAAPALKSGHDLLPVSQRQLAAYAASVAQVDKRRFAIKQAERLYQELPMFAREALTELLDGFEEAMDIGDKDSIVRHRAALKEFLDRNDPETQQADDESW